MKDGAHVTRNILQDAANTLPRMIMGERMSYADLETLAQRSDGTLSIDLLKREARDISGVLVPLLIVDHLADWMVHRLGKNGVDFAGASCAHPSHRLGADGSRACDPVRLELRERIRAARRLSQAR